MKLELCPVCGHKLNEFKDGDGTIYYTCTNYFCEMSEEKFTHDYTK
jgi:hypothetical protein